MIISPNSSIDQRKNHLDGNIGSIVLREKKYKI